MEPVIVTAQPRIVDAGHGLEWWRGAWALFVKNPGMWILLGIIVMVIFGVLSFIPFIGTLAAPVLMPVFIAGWLLAARKFEGGGTLEVGDLFAGFKQQLNPLLVLGALLLAAVLVVGVIVGALGLGAAVGMAAGGSHGGMMAASMGAGMLAMLVMLVLGVVVAMAFWFAPALVALRGVAPVDALKLSFSASIKNIVAMLLYGVIYLGAAIVASIPFGLGWVVLTPLLLLSVYVACQDVFGADAVSAG